MRMQVDLCREILLAIAKANHPADFDLHFRNDRNAVLMESEISYHLWLLADEGLIAMEGPTVGRASRLPASKPSYLTAHGQCVAALMLSDSRWARAMQVIVPRIYAFPLRMIVRLLDEIAHEEIRNAWNFAGAGNGTGGASPK